MLKYRRIIQSSARRIAAAANRTLDELSTRRIEEEPDFTGEMLGRMKESMEGHRIAGVRWTAKILTSHGPGAQEKKFGADFMGVLHFDLPEYKVRKGFLAQAKHIEAWETMRTDDWNRMVGQCKDMLSITPESFVLIYSVRGIIIIPAVTIISAQQRANPHDFYHRSISRFYEDHFECFVGDLALPVADIKVLERVRARHALLLAGSAEQSPPEPNQGRS